MYAKYGTIPATLNPFYSKITVQVSFFYFVIAFIYKSALALSSFNSSKSSFIFVTFNSLNTLITPSTASINSSFFGKSSSFYIFMSYLSLGSDYSPVIGTFPSFIPSVIAFRQSLSSLHNSLTASTTQSFATFSHSFSVFSGSFKQFFKHSFATFATSFN